MLFPVPESQKFLGPSPLLTVAHVLFILAISPLAGYLAALLFDWSSGLGQPGVFQPGALDRLLIIHEATYSAVRDLVVIASTLLAAYLLHGNIRDRLALHPPRYGYRSYVLSVLLCIGFAILWFGLFYYWTPQLVVQDFKPYRELLQRSASWIMLPILCVLAPVSEELLFRGFLFPALRNTTLGVVGGAVAASALWTALHVDRTTLAQAQIFGSGLLLSLLQVYTGSVRVPILCHALFNSSVSLTVILFRWPDL